MNTSKSFNNLTRLRALKFQTKGAEHTRCSLDSKNKRMLASIAQLIVSGIKHGLPLYTRRQSRVPQQRIEYEKCAQRAGVERRCLFGFMHRRNITGRYRDHVAANVWVKLRDFWCCSSCVRGIVGLCEEYEVRCRCFRSVWGDLILWN